MANTYVTNINALLCYPTQPQPNCVFRIQWVINGTDGVYSAASYGVTEVTYDPAEPYVAYNELTQEKVVGWVNEYTPAETLAVAQSDIDASIDAQANPPTVELPLPWNS